MDLRVVNGGVLGSTGYDGPWVVRLQTLYGCEDASVGSGREGGRDGRKGMYGGKDSTDDGRFKVGDATGGDLESLTRLLNRCFGGRDGWRGCLAR
jgi:hypothetical protein